MKLAIMQPYFMPYLGYWQLMNAVDKFVLLDNVNFIKKGYINRNYILHNSEALPINISVKKMSQNRNINQHYLNWDDDKWVKVLLKKIEMCYSKAPYYSKVSELLFGLIDNRIDNVSTYLYNQIIGICSYLNINTEIIESASCFEVGEDKGQGRILSINKQLGAKQYINAIGGKELYDKRVFAEQGIELSFIKMEEVNYTQLKGEFVPNLSIIDVMMFNSVEEVKQLLNKYELCEK